MDQQSCYGNLHSLPEARWKQEGKPRGQSEDNIYHNFFRPTTESKKDKKGRDARKGILTDFTGFELSSAAAPPRPPKGQGISVIENPPPRPPKIGLDFSSPAVEAAFHPPETAAHSKPALAVSGGVGKRCILVLSVLLALCFLISLVFISMALVNNFRLSEEVKMLQMANSATASNVSTGLEDGKKERDKIKKDLADVHKIALKNMEDFKKDQEKYRSDLDQQIQELKQNLESICGTCPESWKWFEKSCYFFSSTEDTWKSADHFCMSRGSHLAIIKEERVQSFVALNADRRVHWIGLSDSGTEKDWRWVDGTSTTNHFWAPGEPNNLHDEDCGSLNSNGNWNDLSCGAQCRWICQKHLVC